MDILTVGDAAIDMTLYVSNANEVKIPGTDDTKSVFHTEAKFQ